MMAEAVKLEIVSPERLMVSQQVRSVTLPGSEGYMTVVGEHAPLMTTLKPGFVVVVGLDGTATTYYVRGGFADISPDGLTILADEASDVADFDKEAIRAEMSAAEAQLAAAETPEARSLAQNNVSAWSNLMLDVDHLEQTQVR